MNNIRDEAHVKRIIRMYNKYDGVKDGESLIDIVFNERFSASSLANVLITCCDSLQITEVLEV